MITQKELMELYEYDPLTGALISRLREPLSEQKPNSNGYHVMMINRKRYYAHRLVWLYFYGEFPERGLIIDHKDRNRNNNRIENLRVIPKPLNPRNSSMHKTNTSGCTGVAWHKRADKWVAQIRDEGKQRHLGYFDSFFEACCARLSAQSRLGYSETHGQ